MDIEYIDNFNYHFDKVFDRPLIKSDCFKRTNISYQYSKSISNVNTGDIGHGVKMRISGDDLVISGPKSEQRRIDIVYEMLQENMIHY